MKNEYVKVVNHAVMDTENEKVKLVVQSVAHKEGEPVEFIDIRKFRDYGTGGELMFTPKGIHFHNDQLYDVIIGLLHAYDRINEKDTSDIRGLLMDKQSAVIHEKHPSLFNKMGAAMKYEPDQVIKIKKGDLNLGSSDDVSGFKLKDAYRVRGEENE